MPKQISVFGHALRLSPRRLSALLASIAVLVLLTLFFTLTSPIATRPSLSHSLSDHKVSIPKIPNPFSSSILNPFRQAAHAPPVQTNSTYGGSSWYANWNWLSPFSSSVTLDENRSLLPPLRERPPIYCYYDTTSQRDAATKDAESDLLLTWRRAWWAQGFMPVILSPAEAMNNPLYDELQRQEVDSMFKTDMMRWLAWENMGGGILASHLLFPMGPHEDALLAFLRRGHYPVLTRWEGLDDGLFAGSKDEITATVTLALRMREKRDAKDFIEAVPGDAFFMDKTHDGVAFYSTKTVEQKYRSVADELGANRAAGTVSLTTLINSHLHTAWQDLFPKGIACVKPLPTHTTHMIEPALKLAKWLSQCPDTPVAASCPPNIPKCSPCVASHPMKISTPARYRNTTGLYTIGTVPHPLTLATLNSMKVDIDVPWIRRHMIRDSWLAELTKEFMGTGVSGSARIVKFKEVVAGEWATSHSVWVTAEQPELPHDLDWYFGFEIPVNGTSDGKSETPVPGPERRPQPQHDPADGPIPKEEDFAREPELMKKARDLGTSKVEQEVTVRNAMEAWNLADTEAWRFARAFMARARVERMKWEEEESRYAGGAGSDKGTKRSSSSFGRWS